MKNLKTFFLYFFAKKYFLTYHLVKFLEHYRNNEHTFLCIGLHRYFLDNNIKLSSDLGIILSRFIQEKYFKNYSYMNFWGKKQKGKAIRILFLESLIKSL